MSTSPLKCRRTSTEQASPRADTKKSKRCIFAPTSPTSSSSQSPSPPRRRDVLKSTVINAFRPRTTAAPRYRGVRYREELNKYVSEIRPTRCSKKIWLGTYDTAEEAARAFDIGNLCCKKNLPLNFHDSPSMLKKISSQLSPAETRSAIAKLAKEVARAFSSNPNSNGDVAKQEPVDQAPILQRPEFVQNQAFQPRPEPELPQIQHLAAAGIYSNTYIEQLPENVCAMEEVATAMPLGERAGDGSRSWSFDLSIGDVSLPDNLTGIPLLIDTPDVGQDQMYEDHMYFADPMLYGDHLYEDCMRGDVYFYSHQ